MEGVIADQLDWCHVQGVFETWRSPCDKTDKPLIQEEETTILTHNRRRGYGGNDTATPAAVMFEVTHTHTEHTCQYITIRVRDIYAAMMYIPPAATKQSEQDVLCDIARQTREKSVLMEDLGGSITIGSQRRFPEETE